MFAGAAVRRLAACGRSALTLQTSRLALRATVPLPAPRAVIDGGAVRFLNLHEYQSKDLMEKFGVQVGTRAGEHLARIWYIRCSAQPCL